MRLPYDGFHKSSVSKIAKADLLNSDLTYLHVAEWVSSLFSSMRLIV